MISDTTAAASRAIVAEERRHLRFALGTLSVDPPAIERGRGSWVHDADGRSYLDLFAGAGRCVLGHGDASFAAALGEQAGTLAVTRHPSTSRAALGAALVHAAPAGLTHVSMFSTGSEAVDACVRIARAATGRRGIVVFSGAFHGRTTGVASLTDPAWISGAAPDPSVRRCPFPVSSDEAPRERVAEALAAVANVFDDLDDDVAAVVVEPVQGTSGNYPAAPGFLPRLASFAKARGALVVADEVLTGFGRTGAMFAVQNEDMHVDLMPVGKGMGNGFPVTAVLSRPDLVATLAGQSPGSLSSTYGGNPLAVAASRHVLDAIHQQGLSERARQHGAAWLVQLRAALTGAPLSTRVHGKGLMIGIELADELSATQLTMLDQRLVDHGLLVGRSRRTLRLNPPLTIQEHELDEATRRIRKALSSGGA